MRTHLPVLGYKQGIYAPAHVGEMTEQEETDVLLQVMSDVLNRVYSYYILC